LDLGTPAQETMGPKDSEKKCEKDLRLI